MKRHGNLFDKIIDKDNLRLAHKNARKNKTDYSEVVEVDNDLENKINELYDMLVNQTYIVSDYTMFVKNDKGKKRKIYKLPYFPDRIIHHAILQVLEPIWKPMLVNSTYQSIKGRGVTKCKRDVHKVVENNIDKEVWIVKVDIFKYYPSVPNKVLKIIIQKKIKCKYTLSLLFTIIDSSEGLPIGNYISQYLGNIFLMYLDYALKCDRKAIGYFRYCDDIVIMSNSKEDAKYLYLKLIDTLEKEYSMSLNSKSQYFNLEYRFLDFVGYRFYKDGSVKLRRSIKTSFVKSAKCCNDKAIASYWGWVKEAKAYGLWIKYMKEFKWK